jgi:TolB protein
MNADGSNPVNLTNNPALDAEPAWSPDGTRIAFQTDRDGGNREIYVMNADGSSPVNLTNDLANDGNPAWSP